MDLLDLSVNLGLDQVLHLHGLDGEQLLALGHGLTDFNCDGNDGAWHGGEHTLRVVDLLGGCHVLVDGVLRGVENCDLDLVTLD